MALKITITGKVHNVGYRLLLLEEADSLLIPNFDPKNVKQNDKEALIVLLDGEEDQIKEFLKIVESKIPEKAAVESIQKEEYNRRVRDIKSYRDSLNTAQLSKIAQTGLSMLDKQDTAIGNQEKMLGNQDTMIGNQGKMIGNQERMLGNQDTMIGNQGKMIGNQEKMLGNQGRMINNQESMIGNQSTIIGNQDRMIGNQEKMIGNQTKMIDRQDTTVSEIRRTREELKTKVEEVNCSVREGFEGNGEKIDSLRDDLKHVDPA